MKNKLFAKLSIIVLIVFAAILSLGYVIYSHIHKKMYF